MGDPDRLPRTTSTSTSKGCGDRVDLEAMERKSWAWCGCRAGLVGAEGRSVWSTSG